MDLDPLPPESPDPSSAYGAPPWDAWPGAQSAVAPLPAPAPRRSAHLKVIAGVSTVALLGGAAFAVGTWGGGSGAVQAAAAGAPAGPGPFRHREVRIGGVSGSVAGLSNGKFHITLPRGKTVDVTTTTATVYMALKDGAVTDVAKGDHVIIAGTRSASGDLTATTITKLGALGGGPALMPFAKPAGPPPPAGATAPGPAKLPPFVSGTVASNSGGIIMLTDRRGGTVKVTTTATTVVVESAPAKASDLKDGLTVTVAGRPPSPGPATTPPTAGPLSITAGRITIIEVPPGQLGPMMRPGAGGPHMRPFGPTPGQGTNAAV